MKLKKIFLSVLITLVFVLMTIPQNVFASKASTPKWLGRFEERLASGFAYSIGTGGEEENSHRIWNIVEWDSETANTYKEANIYCVNPKVGMGATDNYESDDNKYQYNTYYNMKEEKDSVKGLSTINNTEITLSDNTKISSYDAILALGDMLYLPGKSSAKEKEELLKTIIQRSKTDMSASDYVDGMTLYPLTDDDINAVQQAAFWYFTNYGEEMFNRIEDSSWLSYKTGSMEEYKALTDYNLSTQEGRVRNAQANVLYKYLIEAAEENAKYYATNSTDDEEDISIPAVVTTTKLNYEESGDNYIVGPIKITERRTNIPYTIDFSVKNNNTEVTTYRLLNSNKTDVTSSKSVEDLVGEDFYISIDKNSVQSLKIDIDINYGRTNLVLWTLASDLNGTQPVVIPERTPDKESKSLTLKPEEKVFDLALRKYITKVNGVEVLNTRVPNIEENTLVSGTTATYKHRKDPVSVETGDIVTYKITIYNEGEKAGRSTKIVDQLPAGLKFTGNIISGNFVLDSYSETGENKLVLKRKDGNTDNLEAYTTGNLKSETIEFECEVTATPDSRNQKILTNIAWISEAYDAEDRTTYSGEDIGHDRDSAPGTHPNVNKNSDYKENNLSNPDIYYEGQQDDDDFEKIVMEPEAFDLKLIKNITQINGQDVEERLESIDVTRLNRAGSSDTTATYNMNKNSLPVAKGDIVTYRLRVYNEGTIDGYASEITEDIPEGLQFLWSTKSGEELNADTTLSEAEKEAIEFNQQYLWGNFKYDDNREKIIEISSDYLSKAQEGSTESNLIRAFGKNDGTKTEDDLDHKEIFVKMKVVSENVKEVTIRNEACISEDTDKDGNEIEDRDSDTEDWVKYEDDEDYDKIILKPFDLSLRKFITAVSDDEEIENNEYLKNSDGSYTRAPEVELSNLNQLDAQGNVITTAIYNHTKEPLVVKKNDIVVYTLRVYNEGDIDGYAAEIKDHLPSNLEFIDNQYNRDYGWHSEDGKTVITDYLNDKIIKAARLEYKVNGEGKSYTEGELSFRDVPIMCRVKDTAKVGERITNIAEITKYLDDNKEVVTDRDSDIELHTTDGNNPDYKDAEINRGDSYIPGQQDDDDFEKVIIAKFDLALRKQITSIYNSFTKKETKYNDRYAKLDDTKDNTIYDYYDVDSNIPTVVENDVVTYSIRIYNEGQVDGTATWVTDRLPSGLEYLPENETNVEYGWKAYKLSTEDGEEAIKIGEKYYEEVDYDSDEIYMYATQYLKDETIDSYTGLGEADYGEVFMTTRVKSKSEVAEGTEYKLRNIAEIGEDNNDDDDSTPGDQSKWKDQDDVDVEDLKLVEFDLALRKWVTQAIVIEDGNQTVTETGHQPYDDPEQVVKVELHRKKVNQVTVKFRYSIRIINEGDIAGYAREITDYVPTGLKFVAEDNPGWTDEGNNVISTRLLENTLLQPGEFADVEVLLTWVNNENNMGVMVNTAEISEDYNEYGVPDRDSTPDNQKWGEDDIDDAPVMLAISTGQARIYFVLGFIVLVTVAGGVVLIKKYVL